MAEYRIYRLDGVGRVSSSEWVEARSDEDALKHARDRYIDAEVWQGDRMVGRIRPSEPGAG